MTLYSQNSSADFSQDYSLESSARGANLCRHLTTASQAFPEQLAVAVQSASGSFFSEKTLSYQELNFAELNRQSDKLAHGLNAYGLTRGMKAVLMVTPSLDFFTLTFALFKAGVVPILVDPGMGVKNLKQCFIESQPDAFIGIPKAHLARKLFGWGKESVKSLITVGGASINGKSCWGGVTLAELQQHTSNEPYEMVWLDQDEMAAILFTSGSTGTPKGVVYSHKMFEAQITALKHDYGIEPGERDLATFPLFSLFGPALGMASIIPEMDASKPITATPDYLFAAIDKYQCSNMFVNPALIERLGQAGVSASHCHKLPSIKRVISAGAPATIASIKHFSHMLSEGVEVLNSYGATESLPLSKMASQALFDTTSVTDNGGGICVGHAIDGVDIAIIKISEAPIINWDESLCLPVGEIGEIVVKGAMVSRGYYRRDSATEQAKIADGDEVRHRMGDLGYLDSDGLLWMCGRKAHRVDASTQLPHHPLRYFSIPCERIFNTHSQVKRSALVGIKVRGETVPLLCIELDSSLACSRGASLYAELNEIAGQHAQTKGISRFLIHPAFPVDIRHNAKIFREKLAVWAQHQHKE
ncbi:AMP-binding protein [Shewanella sp. D64]|uniref:olefin beta-lactone synthetase n=1 Tax=unclassified Shewanella TaxID=196818 RepID=UPI0022BA1E0A|nr:MULTISPECIES: fatty acid CoA ligase family protein [unclassified Shewanella]MEC4726972.1 AMP-binding protein [Shewanella sp. D64]MEC4738531.1 AMP-binding protein [Shewanella sp. E94]WBJ93750.1 AMP-binding protein [Shewanella sp. MTB7]